MLPDLTNNWLLIFIFIQAFDPFLFFEAAQSKRIDKILIWEKDIYKCFIPYKYIILISFHILIVIDFIQNFQFLSNLAVYEKEIGKYNKFKSQTIKYFIVLNIILLLKYIFYWILFKLFKNNYNQWLNESINIYKIKEKDVSNKENDLNNTNHKLTDTNVVMDVNQNNLSLNLVKNQTKINV